MTVAVLEAACVAHVSTPDPDGSVGVTAIDKRPVAGAVSIGALGLEGDWVEDRERHGGRDKAVYAYAVEDREAWARILGRELPAGVFGENLCTRGLDVTGAVIGQTWQVGSAVLQVTSPRMPCGTFGRWLGEAQWVRRFTEQGWPGAYLRVLTAGAAAPGDAVSVIGTPEHGVTIGDVFAGRAGDRDRLRRLLAEGVDLAPSLVSAVERELGAGSGAQRPGGV